MNIEKIIEPYIEIQGGLIPALHAVQNDTGYLDIQSIKTIADGFNISTAEVIDVITYYDDFRLEKEGAIHNQGLSGGSMSESGM